MSRNCPGCFEFRAEEEFCYVTPGGDQASKEHRRHKPKKRCCRCYHLTDSDTDLANAHWVRMNHLAKHYGLGLEELGEMWRSQDRSCVYCEVLIDLRRARHYEVDHKTPVSRGGTTTIGNLQILCRTCNQGKWRQTHDEFVLWIKHIAACLAID